MNDDVFGAVHDAVTAEAAARFCDPSIKIKQHRAPCPFHEGKHDNMSFHDGGFHCFVCGTGGDAIEYVRQYKHISPLEAAKQLNDAFNLGLSFERRRIEAEGAKLAEQRRRANEKRDKALMNQYYDWAEQAFQYCLKEIAANVPYFQQGAKIRRPEIMNLKDRRRFLLRLGRVFAAFGDPDRDMRKAALWQDWERRKAAQNQDTSLPCGYDAPVADPEVCRLQRRYFMRKGGAER